MTARLILAVAAEGETGLVRQRGKRVEQMSRVRRFHFRAVFAGERLPRGRLVTLAGCGHAPQIEQAEVVNALVIDFLSAADPLAEKVRS